MAKLPSIVHGVAGGVLIASVVVVATVPLRNPTQPVQLAALAAPPSIAFVVPDAPPLTIDNYTYRVPASTMVAVRVADRLRSDGDRLVACRGISANICRFFWAEQFARGPWMLIPIENDANGPQYVELRARGGHDLLMPKTRLLDLPRKSMADL